MNKSIVLTIMNCCLALPVLAAEAPQDVAVNIVGRTNDASGRAAVIFEVTNRSDAAVAFSLQTQIKTNLPLKWYPAPSQRKPLAQGEIVSGKSARTFVVPAPAEREPWRALVMYTNNASTNPKKRVFATSPEITK